MMHDTVRNFCSIGKSVLGTSSMNRNGGAGSWRRGRFRHCATSLFTHAGRLEAFLDGDPTEVVLQTP